MYMHLTNYSVNKHSRTYSKDDELGSKRRFSTLNRILSSEGYDVVTLWNNIDDVVIKTIASAWPVLRHNYAASFPQHDVTHACFEILGVDVIIDQNLKPWLLEVNHSPSFHTDGPVDMEVKHALIRDTFTMLNVRAADKRRVVEEDRRRVNDRLLRKVRDARAPAVRATSADGAADGEPQQQQPATARAVRTPWVVQVEWEETHMGGFRRVLPVRDDPDKYTAFLDRQNNQASVFSDTVASKKREQESKQQRAILAERERFPVLVKNFSAPYSMSAAAYGDCDTEESVKKRKQHSRRHLQRMRANADGYHMELVSEVEERERLASLSHRDFLVRSCGVVEYVYLGFFRNRLLTEPEMRLYDEYRMRMDDDEVAASQPELRLRMKSLASKCRL